ncbi:hypothetical protein NEUTE2DRAFT_90037 [Neurospora tetrasperma FGSC 2509]|nr:hypothetical protein NEUTE2DRAFT_90037 [Neurospora tetrasperma FGSC 2509]
MPRLKAITTGSVPSFLDVVLNIDEGDESSSLASQDTWLAQMKAKGTGKLVMYGDDTWLKLFPGTFDRADGTTSFFVAQREMDGIVSQIYKAIETQDHLKSTLFVLCGDHGMNDAGNHGASSPGETSPALLFISPKLKSLQKNQDSPLPDAEDFQFYSTVEQSDLAPTLAALLGFPIPKNNLGVLIPDFLSIWPKKADQAYLLHQNARQIQTVISAASGTKTFDGALPAESCASPTSDYEQLACEWQGPSNTLMSARVGDDMDSQWALPVVTLTIFQWLRKAQELMSGMASNYDMSRLILGQVTALLAVIFSLSATIKTVSPTRSLTPLLVISIAYSVMMFASSYVEEEQHFWYLATSTWFGYLTLRGFKRTNTTFPAHLLLTAFPVLASLRLLRAWNQTGQKHAGTPDIVKLFIEPHPHFLWLLVGLTYFWTHRQLVYSFHGRIPVPINYPVMTGLVLAAFTFKAAFTLEDAPELVVEFVKSSLLDFTRGASLIARARAVFVGLGLVAMAAMGFILWEMGTGGRKRSPRKVPAEAITTLQHLYTILALTQSRTANIPLFLIFNLLYWFLSSEIDAPDGQRLSTVELGISSLLLQYASFFAMGGSNAISSVDLSNAYNGVSNFNVILVGVLTYVGNWAGPVWWAFGTVVLLGKIWRRDQRQKRLGSGNNGKRGSEEKEERAEAKQMLEGGQISPFKIYVAVTTLFTAVSVAAVMAACTILRTHLFVWTVFSPKYLYCVAWSLGQHLVVNVGLSGLLFWLGSL